jgi:polyketide biosynthesis enoyl-CoA hydratase PksH
MMVFRTLKVVEDSVCCRVVLNRPNAGNTISSALLRELSQALSDAERNPACRVVVLEGSEGVFCTGMDFAEAEQLANADRQDELRGWIEAFMQTLRTVASYPKPVLSNVDGKVLAGGVGLVAVSDLVVSSVRSTFCLSEARWGLLPANVFPYLVQRISFQNAYSMALTCRTVQAKEAEELHLVDYLVDDTDATIRQLAMTLARLPDGAIRDLKAFARKMWILSDDMEQAAIDESARLTASVNVQARIRDFLQLRATQAKGGALNG